MQRKVMRSFCVPLCLCVCVVVWFAGRLFSQSPSAPIQVPVAVVGAFYGYQLQAPLPPVSTLTWAVLSGFLPPGIGLSINGSLVGTPTAPGTFDFTALISSGTPPLPVARQAYRLVVNGPLAIITNATLPDAALATPYSFSLAAAGGLPPYTWTNPGRPLGAGLSLSNSGVISGSPTGVGTFSFTVQVSDNFAPTQEAIRTFTITVAPFLAITTSSLPNVIQNIPFSHQVQATGGIGPYTWVVTSGRLPPGLTLTSGGLLEGTPEVVGSESVAITITDSRGVTNTRNFTVVVNPPISSLSVPELGASLKPAQQTPIQLSLSAPHPSPLSGKLTLSFTSKADVLGDDPMTRFSTGARTVDFTIPANSTTAVFSSQVLLLTGTVAGTVRLTANIQDGPSELEVATVEILAVAPQITDIQAMRKSGGMDVQITGYAPARRVSSIEFIFDMKTGNKTQRVTLLRDVESDFATWYRNPAATPFGSAFSFLQSFTVKGDVGAIESISVKLTNPQGSTTSAPVRPQ